MGCIKPIGEVIDRLRKDRGLSVSRLAIQSMLPAQTVNNIIKGGNPKTETLEMIASGLRVNAVEILAEVIDSESHPPYTVEFVKRVVNASALREELKDEALSIIDDSEEPFSQTASDPVIRLEENGLVMKDHTEQLEQDNESGEAASKSISTDNIKQKPPTRHYANAKRPVPEEALRCLRLHPWTEHRLACELLWALGIRAEELLDIRRKDLETRPGWVYIGRRKEGEQPWLPLLDSLTHPDLRENLTKALVKLPGEPKTQVFTLSYPALYQWCRRNLRVAPNMFRYGIADRLSAAGCNPREIQLWLGHKSITSTVQYLNPSGERVFSFVQPPVLPPSVGNQPPANDRNGTTPSVE